MCIRDRSSSRANRPQWVPVVKEGNAPVNAPGNFGNAPGNVGGSNRGNNYNGGNNGNAVITSSTGTGGGF